MSDLVLHHGDCLDVLRTLSDESVDAVITDPPYGLSNTDPKHVVEALTRWASGERDFVPQGRGFMGKSWDSFVPPPAVWDECFRVLKPGGHLLAFAGSRTFDLLTLSIRFAGFDIRDSIAWLYGSGFPKSMDVSKAIDKAAGAERPVVGLNPRAAQQTPKQDDTSLGRYAGTAPDLTAPATDAARTWEGWGTALKPAFEPIVVARKPLGEKTVAANVLAYGTGALNIDATRIAHASEADLAESTAKNQHADFGTAPGGNQVYGDYSQTPVKNYTGEAGRWPANVVLDESQAAALDEQSGVSTSRPAEGVKRHGRSGGIMGEEGALRDGRPEGHADTGGASRFFYVAKAPKKERPISEDGTAHPTVKPLTLMRWLVKLVTPPGGVVLEPFPGSGTTVEAALLESFGCIAIEREAEYLPLIVQRVERNGATIEVIRPPEPGAELSWEERRTAAYWCLVAAEGPHPRGTAPGCSCEGQTAEILPETEPV